MYGDSDNGPSLLGVYVDDIIIAGPDIDRSSDDLAQRFLSKDSQSPLLTFSEAEFSQTTDVFLIHQRPYAPGVWTIH